MPHKNEAAAREYRKKYYANRQKQDINYYKKVQYDWRVKNPKQYILTRARGRAKAENVPFSITKGDIVIPKYCPIFPELQLEFTFGRKRPDNIPSIDRIS